MKWMTNAAIGALGLALLVLAEGGCGGNPSAVDPASVSASIPAAGTRVSAKSGEVEMIIDCSKSCVAKCIDNSCDQCRCKVVTSCSNGETYTWMSEGTGSCYDAGFCYQGSEGCPN